MDEIKKIDEGNSEITLRDLAKQKDAIEKMEREKKEEVAEISQKIENLTPEDRNKIEELKSGINLLDSQLSTQYGVGAQRNLSAFSDTILSNIKAKDAGEVGVLMTELMEKVKGMEIENISDKGGFFSNLPFVKNVQTSIERMMGKYEVMEIQIDKIEGQLDKARLEMLKDIAMFDTLYQKNLEYFNDLQLYIIAGEEKLAETRNVTLPKLREEALQSGEPMDAQLVSDFEETLNRFDRKLHDLKLSKTLAIQTAPQIKLIQNNDKLLVDKIQTAILNTIPLWKSQIVIALGLHRQDSALKMQQAVTETTNELLRRNSEMIKQNTIGVAKESERGIVEFETLKKVNEDLITTIQETLKIQREGRQKRLQVEAELTELEGKLKETLLQSITEDKNQ
ncbi:toxic anion resistance protein [Microaceticoccus formicicus]|uniref:toxic anion resistance protein n=1 Tax=Microaceticoccus formicicus TaxID=3118105 RepID=UPI003CD02F56|nr:toxic anion resistance protein [Peptoniphilaceae bacterium AMB_02]